jgi:hypothetical protein
MMMKIRDEEGRAQKKLAFIRESFMRKNIYGVNTALVEISPVYLKKIDNCISIPESAA